MIKRTMKDLHPGNYSAVHIQVSRAFDQQVQRGTSPTGTARCSDVLAVYAWLSSLCGAGFWNREK